MKTQKKKKKSPRTPKFYSKLLWKEGIISLLFYVILPMTNTGSDTKESLNKYFLNECYSEIHESGALLTKEF